MFIMTRRTKKSLGAIPWVQQEVGHFGSKLRFWRQICDFQPSYFNELLLGIWPQQLEIWSVSTTDMRDEKLSKRWVFAIAEGVWPAGEFRSFAMKFETAITPAYMIPRDPNLLWLIKSPALNASMWQYWIWVIAPPTGNRKLHVLRSDALWVAQWSDPPQIYSE